MVDEPLSDEELMRLADPHRYIHAPVEWQNQRLVRLAQELQATRARQVEREREVVDDLAEALGVPVSSPDGHEERRLTYREAVDWVGSRTRMWSALLRRVEEVDTQWLAELRGGGVVTEPGKTTIYDEIQAERLRAHTKHGATSMEMTPVGEMYRAVILGEEIGEVSEVVWAALWALALTAAGGRVDMVMNDGRHSGQLNLVELRRELLQTATMAASWADRIPRGQHHSIKT